MAQFDVHRYSPRGVTFSLVMDIQHTEHDWLATREVIPLYPKSSVKHVVSKLNPVVRLDGQEYFLATQEMAAVNIRVLGAKVASLSECGDEILAAVDFLISGF
jgi:toxin CcdB